MAGARKLRHEGVIGAEERVVCVLTGHGLKDPDTAVSAAGVEPVVVKPTLEDVMRVIGL